MDPKSRSSAPYGLATFSFSHVLVRSSFPLNPRAHTYSHPDAYPYVYIHTFTYVPSLA